MMAPVSEHKERREQPPAQLEANKRFAARHGLPQAPELNRHERRRLAALARRAHR